MFENTLLLPKLDRPVETNMTGKWRKHFSWWLGGGWCCTPTFHRGPKRLTECFCRALALVHAAVLAGLLHGLWAVMQRFQLCNKTKTILVGLDKHKQLHRRLMVNIYFSPAICSSPAVSTNIVKFYCSSKSTMCTCSGMDQYFIKLSCPRNSAN